MDKLKLARAKINEIDREMAELFCERMKAASEIADYKKERGLKIYDKTREDELIRKNSALVETSELPIYGTSYHQAGTQAPRLAQEHAFIPRTQKPRSQEHHRQHKCHQVIQP